MLLVLAAFVGNAAPAGTSTSLSCLVAPSFSLAKLADGPSWPGGGRLLALSSSKRLQGAKLGCLAQTHPARSKPSATHSPTVTQTPAQQVTLWRSSESLLTLLRLQDPVYQQLSGDQSRATRDYFLAIGNLASLATRINWVSRLVKPLLTEDAPDAELQLQFGQASLKAKLDFMAGLLQYVVESLRSSSAPLPSGEGVTLVFNFNGVIVDVSTALKGSPANSPKGGKRIGLDHITVTISRGGFSSAAELNPADFTITRGHLQLRFHLGLDSITSTTNFTKEEGLTKEVLEVSARWGGIDWVGQATFAPGLQEYKLRASLNPNLAISTSSLWTPEGFVPGFGFSLNFCVVGCGSP